MEKERVTYSLREKKVGDQKEHLEKKLYTFIRINLCTCIARGEKTCERCFQGHRPGHFFILQYFLPFLPVSGGLSELFISLLQ